MHRNDANVLNFIINLECSIYRERERRFMKIQYRMLENHHLRPEMGVDAAEKGPPKGLTSVTV